MTRIMATLGIIVLLLAATVGGLCGGDESNKEPEITSTASSTASQNSAYTYEVEAEDENEGDELTFSLDAAPTGMTIDDESGVISWTPTQAGSFSVTVKVKDGKGGSDEQSFTITVTGAATGAPDITSSPVTTATDGQAYTYTVQATGGTAPLTFSLDQAPTGMTINATTGAISWTADDAAGSTVAVTAKVRDAGGLSDTQSFIISFTNPVKKYAVIYGISDYLNLTADTGDLNYCDEDANDWYNYLSSAGYECQVYGHLKSSDYSLYTGTASEYNVSRAVRAMVANADSNDRVAFISSGHAMPGDDLNEAALVMHDYGTPEGGMDGLYWDTELTADFRDCVAAQTFIFIDTCLADAMGEVFSSPRSGHVMMVASTMGTPDSDSWDYPQYTHGAWTYFYLIQGIKGAGHDTFNLAQVFDWAKAQYRVFYTDPTGLNNPETWWNNFDQPVLHDSAPGTPMSL